MHIILTQNVPHLGSVGDQVTVKDGYARNFLLPRGLAIAASSQNARQIEHQRRKLEKLRQEAVTHAKSEAERVAGLAIVIQAKAGPGGKLFGSVTSRDLQAAFAKHGVELERRAYVLHNLVKNLGNYTATVRLHTDVKVDINFKVEASTEIAPEAAGEQTGAEPAAQPAGDAAAAQPAEAAATATEPTA